MPAPQIAYSTREERLEFVLERYHCQAPSCGFCGSCNVPGGGSAVQVFDDYIEGRCEFVTIASRLWREQGK